MHNGRRAARFVAIIAVLSASSAMIAFAQQSSGGRGGAFGGPPAVGTVASVSTHGFVLTFSDGTTMPVHMSDRTRIILRQPVSFAAIKKGEFLGVAARRDATGTLSAVFDVGYVTYLPKLVTPDRLTAANARLESTYSIAGAGGPGLGGVLVQVFTAPVAVLADAVTYLVAGVLGLSIRHRESLPRAERQPLWPALRQGVSLLWRHPVLRPVLAQSAAFNLLGQVVFTLFLLYGVEQLRLASSTLGVILSVSCLGGLAGAALASRAERRMGTGRVMAWSMAVGSLSLAAIPAAAGSVVAVVAALIAGLILHELGLAVFNVHSLNVRARLVPAEMLGRVTAAWRLGSTGMLALNGVLASVLGELFGVRAAMAVAVGVLALCCLAFLLGPVASWTLEESPEGGKDGAS